MLLVPIPFFMDSTPPSDISVIFSLIWHTPTCYKEILDSLKFSSEEKFIIFFSQENKQILIKGSQEQ
jgi:hypothetical protein